jgi:hypothetical protein
MSVGQMSVNQTSVGQVGQMSVNQTSVGQVGQMSANQMPLGLMHVSPVYRPNVCQLDICGQMFVSQMSATQMPVGNMHVSLMCLGQMSMGQIFIS